MKLTGELLLKLGEYEKADSIYKGLLKRNPENVAYYKGAQEAIKLGNIQYCKIKLELIFQFIIFH